MDERVSSPITETLIETCPTLPIINHKFGKKGQCANLCESKTVKKEIEATMVTAGVTAEDLKDDHVKFQFLQTA